MRTILNLLFVWAAISPLCTMAQDANRPESGAGLQAGDRATSSLNPKPPEYFPVAIEAILNDFPYNFWHITGELLAAQAEIENYASVIELPGAVSCTITRYHSKEDTTASWQARMFEGDHFPEASRAYGELYRKLQRCYLKLADGSLLFLKGEWRPAKEEAPFTTSALKLQTGDPRYKYLTIEVELVYLVSDWVININIMSKKPDDAPAAGNDNSQAHVF
ncbi:MAG: hypothetical protein P4L51_09355 [Puia sp.]|nr:hypothetical protein [Puia sp.]